MEVRSATGAVGSMENRNALEAKGLLIDPSADGSPGQIPAFEDGRVGILLEHPLTKKFGAALRRTLGRCYEIYGMPRTVDRRHRTA